MSMRVSTGMIYDAGVGAINRQTASLIHSQQQIASGRRNLTPSDDPVAAARALEVTQAKDITSQYSSNQDTANATLSLADSNLSSATDLLVRVKQLAIQGANGALTTTDRLSISTELRARFDELVGIANSTDGTGLYLFSGYQGTSAPFAGTVAAGVTYSGDDGQRLQQVSSSRQIPISESGNAIFNRVVDGNGYFSTSYTNNVNTAAPNTGTGVIGVGAVSDPVQWNTNAANLKVNFWVDAAGVAGTANKTYYDLVDTTTGNSLFTGAASVTGAGGSYVNHPYTPGQAISISNPNPPPAGELSFDYGASVIVTGAPADGDSFSVTKSSSQSIFSTLTKLINTLESASNGTPAGAAKFATDIGSALQNLDQASQNILTVRAGIGSRLNEVDSLKSVNSDLNIQYDQTLSNLQDLDYAKTITDLTRGQTQLQASQQSFAKVSQLSLFNYL